MAAVPARFRFAAPPFLAPRVPPYTPVQVFFRRA